MGDDVLVNVVVNALAVSHLDGDVVGGDLDGAVVWQLGDEVGEELEGVGAGDLDGW